MGRVIQPHEAQEPWPSRTAVFETLGVGYRHAGEAAQRTKPNARNRACYSRAMSMASNDSAERILRERCSLHGIFDPDAGDRCCQALIAALQGSRDVDPTLRALIYRDDQFDAQAAQRCVRILTAMGAEYQARMQGGQSSAWTMHTEVPEECSGTRGPRDALPSGDTAPSGDASVHITLGWVQSVIDERNAALPAGRNPGTMDGAP